VTIFKTRVFQDPARPLAIEEPLPSKDQQRMGHPPVAVDELVKGVNIALGNVLLDGCLPFDTNRDRMVTVDELVAAVNAALNGCG
jgi:hypothetical protein